MKITVLITSIYVLVLEGNSKKLIEIVDKKYSPIRERETNYKKESQRRTSTAHSTLPHCEEFVLSTKPDLQDPTSYVYTQIWG